MLHFINIASGGKSVDKYFSVEMTTGRAGPDVAPSPLVTPHSSVSDLVIAEWILCLSQTAKT